MMEEPFDREQIAQLVDITSCSQQEAEFLLGASAGDLAVAVQLYKGTNWAITDDFLVACGHRSLVIRIS